MTYRLMTLQKLSSNTIVLYSTLEDLKKAHTPLQSYLGIHFRNVQRKLHANNIALKIITSLQYVTDVSGLLNIPIHVYIAYKNKINTILLCKIHRQRKI